MQLTIEQIEAYIDGKLSGAQMEEVERALAEDKMSKVIYDYLVSDVDADYDESQSYPNLDNRSLVDSIIEKIQQGEPHSLLHDDAPSVYTSILSDVYNDTSPNSTDEPDPTRILASSLFQSQIEQIEHIINDAPEDLGSSEQLGFSTDF